METIYACSILSKALLFKAFSVHNTQHGVRFFLASVPLYSGGSDVRLSHSG